MHMRLNIISIIQPHKMFHLPVCSKLASTLCAVLLISESLSLLNSISASQIRSSNLSGLPSQIIWSILFLMRQSGSPTSSKTLSQKTSMSRWTLQGQSCLTASSLTSLSWEWVYQRIRSMSSVLRQIDMSSLRFGYFTQVPTFFLLSFPFFILIISNPFELFIPIFNSFTNSNQTFQNKFYHPTTINLATQLLTTQYVVAHVSKIKILLKFY